MSSAKVGNNLLNVARMLIGIMALWAATTFGGRCESAKDLHLASGSSTTDRSSQYCDRQPDAELLAAVESPKSRSMPNKPAEKSGLHADEHIAVRPANHSFWPTSVCSLMNLVGYLKVIRLQL
jgi:hypothetical protein